MTATSLLTIFLFAVLAISSVSAVTFSYDGCRLAGGTNELPFWAYTCYKSNVELCVDTCAFNGYYYAGLINGDECRCGNTVANGPSTDCTYPCSGNPSQMSGQSNANAVYRISQNNYAIVNATYLGCYKDLNYTYRDMPFMAGAGTPTSIVQCQRICALLNYTYAGLAQGICRCGNSYGHYGLAAADSNCDFNCNTGTGKCGGDALNSVYEVHVLPLNGGWDVWTTWTTCTATCGGGTQTRNRTCTSPAPAYGGLNCPGNSTDQLICHPEPCPVDGGWAAWSSWGLCSAPSGPGTQSRNRNCTNPPPTGGGQFCPGNGGDTRSCCVSYCSVAYGSKFWSPYSTGQPSRLLNAVFQTNSALRVVDCTSMCLRQVGCASFNFAASLSVNNCELSNQTHLAYQPNFAATGWMYYFRE